MVELTSEQSKQYAKDFDKLAHSIQDETSYDLRTCLDIAMEILKAHIISNT